MIWTALRTYSTMFISFISGIILARLLTPFDYGCIGMLTIFMVFARAFIDGGLGSALIQKKNPSQIDYSTIFWWNIGMSVFVYAILYFCAPFIAEFYKTPLLAKVLRIQGLVLFIYAFNLIQINQLKKALRFKILSVITIVSAITALVVTIIMAYNGYGVWALVAQNILISLIPSLFFWFYVKWRPTLHFSGKSFKDLFGFGFFMLLTNLLNNIGTQIQGLFIGRWYNPSTMGYYSKALSTEQVASHAVSTVITQVSYPLYAEVQDDKPALINMIRRMSMTLAYVSFPLMVILILCAKPLFIFLYSDRWLDSIPYFQVLCIAGLAGCMISINTQPIAAIGKSNVMFYWTIVKRIAGISFVVFGLIFWGMTGLLVGVVLNAWFSYFVNIWLVSKYIGYKWTKQIGDWLPMMFSSLVIGVICFLVGYFSNLGMYLRGGLVFVLYVGLYISWSIIFKPEGYKYFLSLLPIIFRRLRK